MGRWVYLIALCCALPVSVSAQGEDDDPDRARARVLYQQARELDANGRTAEAITLAEEAYRLYPSAGTRYALGLLHERAGETEVAIDQYRMALAEPVGQSASLDAQVRAGLARLGGETQPLEPAPVGSQRVEDAGRGEDDPAEGAPLEDPDGSESAALGAAGASTGPSDAGTTPARPREGLRVRGGLLADVTRIDRAWAFSVAAGWISDVGAFVELAVSGPHLAVWLEGGVEIGDAIVRPILSALIGLSPLRAFDGPQDGGLFVGPRVGLALHPFEDLALSFSLDAALAIDVLRANDGFIYAVPVGLGVRWVP